MGRRSWVEPIRPQPGGVAAEFAITFQEATLALQRKCRQVIAKTFGEASVPFVNEMEISVDLIPKVSSNDARSRMVAVLSRHLLPNRDVLTRSSDRPRSSWGRGRLKNNYLMTVSRLKPFNANRFANVSGDVSAPVDATYYAGNRRVRAMWRVMDKIIDRQNDGTWIALPDEEKRARIEVKLDRLELHCLGLQTFDQLMTFNFAKLQGTFFKFMLPTFLATGVPMQPADRYWEQERMKRFLNVGVIGLQAMDQWRSNERKKHRPALVSYLKARKIPASEVDRRGAGISANLVAYQDLNDRVSMALRKLVERERRGIGV